jgi:phosphoenolpyruvate carboxykinase (GTP)
MAGTSELRAWVDDCARLTRPDKIVWCDGSEEEYQRFVAEMLADGTFIEVDHEAYPNSYLSRSDPSDVARVEKLTLICSEREEDAGPTNNWEDPKSAKERLTKLFDGVMRGRTMYVVPYLMATPDSPHAKVGVELTDSLYVVANMRIMTRMGQVALDVLERNGGEFAPGLHSIGDLDPNKRWIAHFPEENLVWSIGSGYGGNALLGKKCLSLRLASVMARREGWMAEHMLILGLEDPQGQVHYMAGAFPSACGKTNLAMLVSPLADMGWKVWTVGDDIAWMRIGDDGRLWAVNPENGFFGVAPGTNVETNPNAMASLSKNAIFTNVGLTPDKKPWWEGIDPAHSKTPPAGTINWLGKEWHEGDKEVAHANSRFTAPASQCPAISPHWEDPEGVPISAFIFGGRRAGLAPLVYQALDWEHGVFVGAGMGSEMTAAAEGGKGQTRRDPMAMLPFCGYNMGDYWSHWLDMGKKLTKPPVIFHVNWFRKDANGKFLWPGFGENVRVLMWMAERIAGQGKATETPIGYVPSHDALYMDGLDVPEETMHQLLAVSPEEWEAEAGDIGEFFARFGSHLPAAMAAQHEALRARLAKAAAEVAR